MSKFFTLGVFILNLLLGIVGLGLTIAGIPTYIFFIFNFAVAGVLGWMIYTEWKDSRGKHPRMEWPNAKR